MEVHPPLSIYRPEVRAHNWNCNRPNSGTKDGNNSIVNELTWAQVMALIKIVPLWVPSSTWVKKNICLCRLRKLPRSLQTISILKKWCESSSWLISQPPHGKSYERCPFHECVSSWPALTLMIVCQIKRERRRKSRKMSSWWTAVWLSFFKSQHVLKKSQEIWVTRLKSWSRVRKQVLLPTNKQIAWSFIHNKR